MLNVTVEGCARQNVSCAEANGSPGVVSTYAGICSELPAAETVMIQMAACVSVPVHVLADAINGADDLSATAIVPVTGTSDDRAAANTCPSTVPSCVPTAWFSVAEKPIGA